MPDDFEIPEFSRIGSMMHDLMADDAQPRTVASPSPRRQRPPRTATGHRRSRLAPVLLSQFVEGVNWLNAAKFESPLVPPPPLQISRFTLAQFASCVNWANAMESPAFASLSATVNDPAVVVTAPQPTVDSFLSEFSWD